LPDADALSRADLDLLSTAAAEAGTLALGWFRRDPRVWTKGNASPVSEADLAVDAFLRDRLTAARPDYGWLSEETEDDRARLATRRLFVVDPIDGTRGFLAGSDEWTVSLAVVEDGRPAVAVLVQPSTGRTWTARTGAGAHLDGDRLAVAPPPPIGAARATGPSSMRGRFEEATGAGFRGGPIASLALRIAMVADGRLDLAFAKPNAHDWDIAAADLILTEAGGVLIDPAGERLAYNRPDPRHPALVAAAPALARSAADLVAPARATP
jgi:myo-inositol-1(or 4)-monophosphatase